MGTEADLGYEPPQIAESESMVSLNKSQMMVGSETDSSAFFSSG